MRRQSGKEAPSINKEDGVLYKGISPADEITEVSRQESVDRKGATRFNGIFGDFVNELYQSKGAFMWQVKTLPWRIHPSLLVKFREVFTHQREKGEISDNVRRVSVATIPTFPSREFDGVEYLKIVFVHVTELAKDTMDEIIKLTTRARTRILSYRQTEVRDTCIVVIADNQEKGANVIMQQKARMKATSGTRIAYVFGTKQGARIRKLLYGFLGNYLTKRAEAIEGKATENLKKAGTDRGIYGSLKDCCEFVTGLGTKLKELAGRIKIPWGARKTKEERARDKLISSLDTPQGRTEEEAETRQKMRELARAEMLKKERSRAFITAT